MCSENKYVLLWLELQAENLLDEPASDMSSVWTPTKWHLSLQPGLSFSYNFSILPSGKEVMASLLDERGSIPQLFSAPQPLLLGMPTEPDPQVAEQVYTTDIGDSIQCFNLCCLALFVMLQGAPTEWLAATLECRVIRCGGSCTAPASPSGMSKTHQGILKGTKTGFCAAECMP